MLRKKCKKIHTKSEENYKTLITEMEDLNKWKDSICSYIGRTDSLSSRCLFFSTWFIKHDPSQNPSKLSCGYLQTDFKGYTERQRPRVASTVWKEYEVGGLILPNILTYYKTIITRLGSVGGKTGKQISGTAYKAWKWTPMNVSSSRLTKEQRQYTKPSVVSSTNKQCQDGWTSTRTRTRQQQPKRDINPSPANYLKVDPRPKCGTENRR